ncbi:hypothetical protein FlaCF_2869 [Flavobacterium tructae]
MKLQNIDFNISKLRIIFQPVLQILMYTVMYSIIWSFLYNFNIVKKHELWDLTTIYLFGCFAIVSLISGIFLLFLKKINYTIFIFLLLLFCILTINDFRSSPKVISLAWIEAGISILVCNLFFANLSKNRNKK